MRKRRRAELDALGGIHLHKPPHAAAQDSTDQDVGIENNHLSGQTPSRDDATV